MYKCERERETGKASEGLQGHGPGPRLEEANIGREAGTMGGPTF